MSLKSRIVKIVAIVFVVVAFAGYFAFTTFLFNPLESDLGVPNAALVPRDVDFFLGRAHIDELFSKFPRLVVQDQLDKNKGWQAWIASPEYADLDKKFAIEKTLADARESIKQIPLGMEPQQILGGQDLVVAGYFKGHGLEQADWAVYGRANWAGKLGASLMRHPSWIGLEKQGITATVADDYVSLKGSQLPRELFVTRIQDVVIIATKVEFVKAARDLKAHVYADSLYQGALYHDHVLQAPSRRADRKEFEFFLNSKSLLEAMQFKGPWPDPKEQDFLPAFLGRLIQLPSVKSITGVAELDEGAAIDLHGEFASELITPEQQKLYRQRGFDRNELLDQAARMAPADTSLFVYLRGNIGDLLRTIFASVEPAMKQNLEDAFRNTGKYPNLEALISELDGALKDRAAIIVRPNDYPEDPEGPPHNSAPVPAFALILWPKNPDTIINFRELIGGQGAKFGLQGRNPNEPGFFKNTEAGFEIREFWSPFVEGTGMIATANANELTIVTNSFRMLGHILKTSTQGGEKYPRLSETPAFTALVHSSMTESNNGANVFVWTNPRMLAPIMRKRARMVAEQAIAGKMDWKLERARLEDEAIRDKFPGQRRGQLTPEVQKQVDDIVDPKIQSIEQRMKDEQVPKEMAKQERGIVYLEQITAATFLVKWNPKSFDLSARIVAPLSSPAAPPTQ